MSLAREYQRQFAWRNWPAILDALPLIEGKLILDLGCGAGDLAAEFVRRGAHVIGIDINQELIEAARSRGIVGAEFQLGDVRNPPELGGAMDGIWCSFTTAFIADLVSAI